MCWLCAVPLCVWLLAVHSCISSVRPDRKYFVCHPSMGFMCIIRCLMICLCGIRQCVVCESYLCVWSVCRACVCVLSMYRPSMCYAYVSCLFDVHMCVVCLTCICVVCLTCICVLFIYLQSVCAWVLSFTCVGCVQFHCGFGCLPSIRESAVCSPSVSILCTIHRRVLCVLAVVPCVICVPSVSESYICIWSVCCVCVCVLSMYRLSVCCKYVCFFYVHVCVCVCVVCLPQGRLYRRPVFHVFEGLWRRPLKFSHAGLSTDPRPRSRAASLSPLMLSPGSNFLQN